MLTDLCDKKEYTYLRYVNTTLVLHAPLPVLNFIFQYTFPYFAPVSNIQASYTVRFLLKKSTFFMGQPIQLHCGYDGVFLQKNDKTVIYNLDLDCTYHISKTDVVCHYSSLDDSYLLDFLQIVRSLFLLFEIGCRLIHTAVIDYHDIGIMFIGPKGAGKTSVALSLALRGYHFVTNDKAMYHKNQLYGVPQALSLSRTALDLFALSPISSRLSGGKHLFFSHHLPKPFLLKKKTQAQIAFNVQVSTKDSFSITKYHQMLDQHYNNIYKFSYQVHASWLTLFFPQLQSIDNDVHSLIPIPVYHLAMNPWYSFHVQQLIDYLHTILQKGG